MSEGRIDVIATPLFPGEDVTLDIECFEPGVIWLRDKLRVSATLTTEEARYLRDELSGAIDAVLPDASRTQAPTDAAV